MNPPPPASPSPPGTAACTWGGEGEGDIGGKGGGREGGSDTPTKKEGILEGGVLVVVHMYITSVRAEIKNTW